MNISLAMLQGVLIGITSIVGGLLLGRFLIRSNLSADSAQTLAEYARAGIKLGTTWFLGSREASGTLHGVPFVLKLLTGGKGVPPTALLVIPTAFGGAFVVAREGSADRFAKSIGLTTETQTGDTEFDREFYISGGSREYLESFFREAQARDAVRALFRSGFDRVALHGGKLTAVKLGCRQLLELDKLSAAVEQFAVLRATPGAQAASMKEGPAPSSDPMTILALGSALLFVAGSMLLVTANKMTRPLADSLAADVWPGAAAAYLAFAALSVLLLRGRPRAHTECLIILLVVLPGLGLGGWGGTLLTNQFLDESPAREHFTQVESSYVSQRRDHFTGERVQYIVVVAPWRNGRRSVDIAVPGALYRNAQPGQRWIVRTHSGRLGYEWVASAQPAPGP